jgi:hypothetical protein
MMRTVKTSILLISAVVVLLVAVGCNDDDPVQVQDRDDPVARAESPTLLMLQLMAAYEARNVNTYLDFLDPDFQMFLAPETTEEFPSVGTVLDFTEEENIHTRMFSGQAVTDPEGSLVPGVLAISVSSLPLVDWSPTVETDPIQDAEWALYQVLIHFDRGQNYSTLIVEGTVKVYARAHETTVAGKKETYYLLVGMTDLTSSAKGTEDISWGAVKALYR